MAPQIELLKSIAYFSGLKPAELDSISKLIFEKRYDQGEIILLEGDAAEALYFVVFGVVKIFRTSANGKEQILRIMYPGESFNDVPMFNGGLNMASAQTVRSVLLYGITKSDLEVIVRRQPQVALNVIKVMADWLQHLVSLVEDLSFRHVVSRVAKILLEYSVNGEGTEPHLTQRDMAAMAGTVREVVSRSIKALEEEGLVKLDRHRIVITDKAALKNKMESSL
jgi:CRP/FNR family transcriptional regulator